MIEIYDNGGKTLDRYTIFLDDSNDCIGADTDGNGFYQHTTGVRGRHLGKKIAITELSEQLKSKILDEYKYSVIRS